MILYREWDSVNFKMKIGQLVPDSSGTYCGLEEDIHTASKEGYELLYLKSGQVENRLLPDYFYLADEKRVYIKTNEGSVVADRHQVVSWKGHSLDANLLSLSLQSGCCSRFYTDKKIPLSVFLTLYRSWIENSLNGNIATDVLVYKGMDDIQALLTYKMNQNEAIIGLVSVDDSVKGRGIGTELMQSFFSMIPAGIRISVATQKSNKVACAFYEKNGFKLESEINVFHIWPQKYVNSIRNVTDSF